MKSGSFKLNVRFIFEFPICVRFNQRAIGCDVSFSEVRPLRLKAEDRTDAM